MSSANACLSRMQKKTTTLQLAKGASGAVYRGFLYERLVACKVLVGINMQSVDSFLTEAVLLSTCSHPSIIQLMGVCLDPREPSIMLEYASEGSLKDYLSSGSVLHTLSDGLLALLVHVTQGLCFVHARQCVHRDIKVGPSRSHSLSYVYVYLTCLSPSLFCYRSLDLHLFPAFFPFLCKSANILIREDGTAGLSDFGEAIDLKNAAAVQRAVLVTGSSYYCSPEAIKGEASALKTASDIFSMGVVLLEAGAVCCECALCLLPFVLDSLGAPARKTV